MIRRVVLAAALIACACALAWSQDGPPELSGYRMEDYRAPTPATLAGARVVTTAQADKLWKAGASFIDVLPRVPRPANLPAGTIWHEKTRMNIPGSIWLPDTGYGALAPSIEAYFRKGLEHARRGDPSKWLVIYCLRNCWMSWNAARRALTLGYTSIAWYPEGTDGWTAAGLPTEEAKPFAADAE